MCVILNTGIMYWTRLIKAGFKFVSAITVLTLIACQCSFVAATLHGEDNTRTIQTTSQCYNHCFVIIRENNVKHNKEHDIYYSDVPYI